MSGAAITVAAARRFIDGAAIVDQISFEAEAEDLRPEQLVKQVLDKLPVP